LHPIRIPGHHQIRHRGERLDCGDEFFGSSTPTQAPASRLICRCRLCVRSCGLAQRSLDGAPGCRWVMMIG
jgi:hypothetical protein